MLNRRRIVSCILILIFLITAVNFVVVDIFVFRSDSAPAAVHLEDIEGYALNTNPNASILFHEDQWTLHKVKSDTEAHTLQLHEAGLILSEFTVPCSDHSGCDTQEDYSATFMRIFSSHLAGSVQNYDILVLGLALGTQPIKFSFVDSVESIDVVEMSWSMVRLFKTVADPSYNLVHMKQEQSAKISVYHMAADEFFSFSAMSMRKRYDFIFDDVSYGKGANQFQYAFGAMRRHLKDDGVFCLNLLGGSDLNNGDARILTLRRECVTLQEHGPDAWDNLVYECAFQ